MAENITINLTPEQMQANAAEWRKMMDSVTSSQSKSMARQNYNRELEIKSIQRKTGVDEKEIKARLKEIDSIEEYVKKEEQRNKAMAEGVSKALSGLKNFITGSVTAAQTLYNSEQAFTAVIPTLQLLGNAVKTVVSAVSSVFAGLPYIGSMFGAIDKVAGAAIDITMQVGQMLLDNAQKYVTNYNTISKAGITFGGDLEAAGNKINAAGMNMDTFAKFVTTNSTGLAIMGGGMENAAMSIMKMGLAVTETSKGLLTMYGGFEGVMDALAGYNQVVASGGANTMTANGQLTKGAKDYLIQLKSLTELTGVSADQFKKEAEERNKHAAFQARLSEFSEDQQAAIQMRITQIGALYSKEAADYAAESFALRGRVISQQNQMYKAFNGTLTNEIIPRLLSSATLPNDAKNLVLEDTIKTFAPALKENLDRLTNIAASTYASQDSTLQNIDRSTAEQIRLTSLRDNVPEALKTIAANANKMEKGGKETKIYEDLLNVFKEFKREMDIQTRKSFGNVSKIAKDLIDFNQMLMTNFGPLFGDAVKKFAEVIDDLIRALNGGKTPAEIARNKVAVRSDKLAKELADRLAKIAKENPTLQNKANAAIAAQNAAKAALLPNSPTAFNGSSLNKGPKGELIYRDSNSDYRGINLKSAEAVAGGNADQQLLVAIRKIQDKFQGTVVNAIDDAYHESRDRFKPENKKSAHTRGEAADLNVGKLNDAKVYQINQMIKDLGYIASEHQNENGPGKHLHIEKSNPDSNSTLEDVEKKVKSMDGKKVGAIDNNNQVMDHLASLNENIQSLIGIAKDHRDISEKTLWATA